MAISEKDLSNQRKSALTAGISLIIMTIASFFSYGFVHGTLVVQGDASATFINIVSSNNLFKGEILGWIIIMIADILVAWAFYMFLEPVNQNLSLLGAWLRLTYSAILAISILTLIFVLLFTGNTNGFSTLTIEQTQAFMMLFLDAFQFIWSMGLVVFGGHLLIVGYVALKSDVIPKVISILLLLASIGYIIIHLSKMFLTQYEAVITTLNFIFTIPMIVGELGFGIWLLLRGGKIPKSV
ncbi:DUF4386 domain-containing protein [Paenibacillus odorifer]|uniref:DUF4386 domain-containing protein n=1 Tax=Paenibacillus TaxID=44249 RepID=UPI00096CA041|nr:DUF4386 domain-containing protein [Paenibacillus odorifer]OMD12546.1 hypothetical protein BJP47_04820 [Paenibacillus odorifer]OMD25895.1 hypothetical protein BJP48_04835 [Paenibacillus odorifer]OME36309.1 hypothetical protein BSK63_04195 [Paenibacillus odorifer]OME42353.1 hypothetical protein BSK46_00620 [Paenibacillus odorifer]OME60819.1 hypothetical protein BSK59_05210 [Paenibacillus odorifer]